MGTDAEELQSMAEDLIAAAIIRCPLEKVKRRGGNIVYAAASHASHVVMPSDTAVKTGLAAGQLQLLDHSLAGQQFQISIDSAETNLGEPAADDVIQHRCGGVRGEIPEFLQNHLPLPRIPPTPFDTHWLSCC